MRSGLRVRHEFRRQILLLGAALYIVGFWSGVVMAAKAMGLSAAGLVLCVLLVAAIVICCDELGRALATLAAARTRPDALRERPSSLPAKRGVWR